MWCGPATAAHQPGTGTGQRGALSGGSRHPGAGLPPGALVPCVPGRCPPCGSALSPRPARSSSLTPGSQRPWRPVQPLQGKLQEADGRTGSLPHPTLQHTGVTEVVCSKWPAASPQTMQHWDRGLPRSGKHQTSISQLKCPQ